MYLENVNYDYIYVVDTSNLNSRTVRHAVIARIAPGSFNILRQSPFPALGLSFLLYPAAFRARKLPSHVGATNHVRRTGGTRMGRAQKSRAKIPRRMSAKDGGESLRQVNSLHAATTFRKWEQPRCFDVFYK